MFSPSSFIQGSFLLMYILLGTRRSRGGPTRVSCGPTSFQLRGLPGDEDVLGLPLAAVHELDTAASQSHRVAHSPPPLSPGAIDLQLFHQTLCQPERHRDASVGFRPPTRRVPTQGWAVPGWASGLQTSSWLAESVDTASRLQDHAISTECHALPGLHRNTAEENGPRGLCEVKVEDSKASGNESGGQCCYNYCCQGRVLP